MYYGYGYHPFFDILWHIFFIALIIWVIMMFFRGGPRRFHRWHSYSALSILNERFAKGEISKEEYEERRKVLLSQ